MRSLLALLNRVETAGAVLATAGLIAQRLEQPQIMVMHVRPVADPGFMPTEEIMTLARGAGFEARSKAHSAALHALFDTWQSALAQSATTSWREETGDDAAVVAREGAKVDLIVIGHAAGSRPGDGRAAIDAALFQARSPIVVVPAAVPASVGKHVAVAWKPGDTAERAVVSATPLLRAAETVTILIGSEPGWSELAPPPELVGCLAGCVQLAPAMHPFALEGEPTGQALLREARVAGADLLVMGAYSRRRAVEAMLGGATRDILAGADIPVFMHH